MRILVTGSRDWDNWPIITNALADARRDAKCRLADVVIVHGGCPTGADAIADAIAHGWVVKTEVHRADWEKHGKAAGPIRNQEMVKAGADICLAFIKHNSRGATHCANAAEKAGIPVRRFYA